MAGVARIVAIVLILQTVLLSAHEYFDGQSKVFQVGEGNYVAGWDETRTRPDAQRKCVLEGGTLAEIYNWDDNMEAIIAKVKEENLMKHQLPGADFGRFWIGGKTLESENQTLAPSDILNYPGGPRCRVLSDVDKSEYEDGLYIQYALNCDRRSFTLCDITEAIGAEYFNGHSQEFTTDEGRQYVVGWDEAVTQEQARDKCQPLGGDLAEICTSERLKSINNKMKNMRLGAAESGDPPTVYLWINGKTDLSSVIIANDLPSVPDGENCRMLTDHGRVIHAPEKQFTVWSKACSQKMFYLCDVTPLPEGGEVVMRVDDELKAYVDGEVKADDFSTPGWNWYKVSTFDASGAGLLAFRMHNINAGGPGYGIGNINNQDLFGLGMKCTTFDGDETTNPDDLFPGWNNDRDYDDCNWKPPILDSDAPENPGAGIIPGAHGFWGEPANALNVLCRLKLAAPCGYPRRFPPYCS